MNTRPKVRTDGQSSLLGRVSKVERSNGLGLAGGVQRQDLNRGGIGLKDIEEASEH